MKKFASSLPGLAGVITLAFALPTLAQSPPDQAPQDAFEKECLASATLFERDVNANDGGFLDRYFDTATCLDRALEGINAPGRIEEDYRRGTHDGYLGTFSKTLLDANSVRLQRLHRPGKETRILFRIAPKKGGVDYLDLIFAKSRGGAKVVDAETYSSSQTLSHGLRREFIKVMLTADPALVSKLDKADRAFGVSLPQIIRMSALAGEGRHAEVIGLFSRLPDAAQKEKQVLLVELASASQADQRAFNAALDLWRGAYPGEIAIELITANLYYAKRHYEPALAALERFEQALGGDAFIDVVRAQWQKNQNHLEPARVLARKAVGRNPKLHEGWELLISLGMATRNFPEVAQTLTDWEKNAQVDALRVAESEKLSEFTRSAAGRQWLAARDTKRPAGAGAPKTPGAGTAKVAHKLQGIFYSASNPSAIISGRTVFTGDRIAGGYRVDRISAQSVTLQSPEGDSVELALK